MICLDSVASISDTIEVGFYEFILMDSSVGFQCFLLILLVVIKEH